MSPATLRRYRAERLLREEFEGLRSRVLGGVASRLRLAGVRLDASDLDAAYSQAWQGLYAATLAGEEIANPAGWLALVTYRRAIDEHRARGRTDCIPLGAHAEPGSPAWTGPHAVCDFDAELDDRTRLRQLFEGLRVRLSEREQQAATLCYLQGLSRAEAAVRMGISEARMRKLMEGRGAGAPGVAGKVGALVETIRAGAWCEEQGSLMRGLAYGVLDPDGERYALASIHREQCPACRAYVLSLRGLAAALPPMPSLLHVALAGGAGSAGGAVATAAPGTGAGAGSGVAAGAAPAGAGAGALSASGVAAGGAAGGGWWLAGGPLGAKLAVGCLLALGVGAGCVALEGRSVRPHAPMPRHLARGHAASAPGRRAGGELASAPSRAFAQAPRTAGSRAAGANAAAAIAPAAAASREFGPERAAKPAPKGVSPAATVAAVTARAPSGASTSGGSTNGAEFSRASSASSAAAAAPSSAPAAQREFAPG